MQPPTKQEITIGPMMVNRIKSSAKELEALFMNFKFRGNSQIKSFNSKALKTQNLKFPTLRLPISLISKLGNRAHVP